MDRYQTDNLEIEEEDVVVIADEDSVLDLSGKIGKTMGSTRERLVDANN